MFYLRAYITERRNQIEARNMVKESHLVVYGFKKNGRLKFQGWVSELPVCSESTYELFVPGLNVDGF